MLPGISLQHERTAAADPAGGAADGGAFDAGADAPRDDARPRRCSHHLRRDNKAEYGVRGTPELDLTRKPDLLQVALASCAEASAAARASERPAICPWVETAQRPTPTHKSGNTKLQEAPSCFVLNEGLSVNAHYTS